ncbi:hypothetical protein HDV57DRAFT_433818 [Trichoderma longibrachiatum]
MNPMQCTCTYLNIQACGRSTSKVPYMRTRHRPRTVSKAPNAANFRRTCECRVHQCHRLELLGLNTDAGTLLLLLLLLLHVASKADWRGGGFLITHSKTLSFNCLYVHVGCICVCIKAGNMPQFRHIRCMLCLGGHETWRCWPPYSQPSSGWPTHQSRTHSQCGGWVAEALDRDRLQHRM